MKYNITRHTSTTLETLGLHSITYSGKHKKWECKEEKKGGIIWPQSFTTIHPTITTHVVVCKKVRKTYSIICRTRQVCSLHSKKLFPSTIVLWHNVYLISTNRLCSIWLPTNSFSVETSPFYKYRSPLVINAVNTIWDRQVYSHRQFHWYGPTLSITSKRSLHRCDLCFLGIVGVLYVRVN